MKHWVFILFIGLVGCQQGSTGPNPSQEAVARVYDEYLYVEDLKAMGISNTDDTSGLRKAVIENWIQNQLVKHNAEEQILITDKIQKKIDDYTSTLIIHEYRKALMNKASSNISLEEKLAYYEEHKQDFLLEETVYAIKFAYVPVNTQQVNTILESLDEGAIPNFVQEICDENANACKMDTVIWMTSESLSEVLELPEYLQKTTSKFKKFNPTDEKLLIYRIFEKGNKGEPKPLMMVEDVIVQIIQNAKEKENLQEIEHKIYLNAKNNKDFEIYF